MGESLAHLPSQLRDVDRLIAEQRETISRELARIRTERLQLSADSKSQFAIEFARCLEG